MKSKCVCMTLLAFSSLIFTTKSNLAQTAEITGRITDSTGAVMPEADVTVTNMETGIKRSTHSTGVGYYNVPVLQPGAHKVVVQKPGFRTLTRANIKLAVDQVARVDFTMEVGEVSSVIDVTDALPVLARDTSDVGQVITNQQIINLPLNGRNFLQLASLTNGVTQTAGHADNAGAPNFVSEGTRNHSNSYLIGGVDTRVQRNGTYGINLSVDAIGEFKIMQNSFSAEYGRGGTIVNAVVKSGTNDIHGSVFDFLRNDKFDARNAFDATGRKPPLRFNQFGGSVGGPIRKNQTFYFANYEGLRERRSNTQHANLPTPAMFSGDLAGSAAATDPLTGQPFPGNRIPADRISQFAKAAAKYYVTPTGSPLPGNNYVGVTGSHRRSDQATGKIDHQLTQSDQINGQITFFDTSDLSLGINPFTGTRSTVKSKPTVVLQHTHTFSPTLLNDFRFGRYRSDIFRGPDALLGNDVTTSEFGLKNLQPESIAYTPPRIEMPGYALAGGSPFQPTGATDVNLQFVDQVSYSKGRHAVKMGVDLRWLRYDDLGYATANGRYFFNGQYTGNPVADLLIGMPSEAYASQRAGSTFGYQTRQGEFSFYFQDDIKLTRNLTLNAGLRYELVQWPFEVNDEMVNWNYAKGNMDFAGKDIPRRILPTDKNNLAPRLGLAYSPSFLKKTVIRAGGGITYGNYRQYEVALLHYNVPYVVDNFQFNDRANPTFSTATLFPKLDANLATTNFRNYTVNYLRDKVLPIIYQWNLNIQHEILPDLLFQVGYVGNRGDRLPNRYDGNQPRYLDFSNPLSIQERRPYQNVGFISANTSATWSSYNAVDVRLERRFTGGLALLGTYTWSKSMEIRSHDQYTVMDIFNIRHNYGPAGAAHRSVVSYIYDLPFGTGKRFLGGSQGVLGHLTSGWQVNGITGFRSGNRMGVGTSVSSQMGNRAINKADRVGDGNLPSDQRVVERWFDTAAFKAPLSGRYGNSGEGVLIGPGLTNWDLSIFKNTKIAEGKLVQFRCEMFNAFNNVNFNNPDTTVGNPRYGRISAAATAREIQFGLKFLF